MFAKLSYSLLITVSTHSARWSTKKDVLLMGTSRVLRKRSLLFKASALSSSGRWSVLWGAADPGIQSDHRFKTKKWSLCLHP